MPAEAAVRTEGLVKVFAKGNVRAVDGISFEVAPGTVLGLLGPNGAGKTTVVRILSTIITPDEGRATILGHDVVRQAEAVRRLIGLAGQAATVDENLTGRENLQMIGRLNHMAKVATATRTDELLGQFDLVDAANRPLKTYSGGMRRRLDVAAALVARPPVLFLDEPTTGLDPQSRQDLWRVIEELVAAGTTVLLTTQYLEEADRLAQRIVVVDHGRIIADGTPSSLKSDLGTTVISVALGVGADPAATAALLQPLSPKPLVVDGSTIEVTVEEGARVAAQVLRTLDQRQIPVAGLSLREPSLDDVFLSLTGHRADTATAGDGVEAAGTDGSADGAAGRHGRGRRGTPAAVGEAGR